MQDRKEYLKGYHQRWYQRRKAGLPTRTIQKLSEVERKRRKLERNRKWVRKQYKLRDKIFGNKCVICGSKRSLVLHEINGEPHKEDGYALVNKAIKNPEQWRRLCYSCHKGVHWIMKYFGWSWGKIIKTIKGIM